MEPLVDLPPGWIIWEAATPEGVAQLLRARTKDSSGREIGEWSDDTRPTLDEVQGICDTANGELGAAIGGSTPTTCAKGATGTAALLAAMLVELSYFPEQVRSDRSAYQEYKLLYDAQLAALQQCIASGGEGGGVEYGKQWGSIPTRSPVLDRFAARSGVGGIIGTEGPWGDLPPDHWPEPENPENWRDAFQPPREPPEPEDLPVGDEPASGLELLP